MENGESTPIIDDAVLIRMQAMQLMTVCAENDRLLKLLILNGINPYTSVAPFEQEQEHKIEIPSNMQGLGKERWPMKRHRLEVASARIAIQQKKQQEQQQEPQQDDVVDKEAKESAQHESVGVIDNKASN